MGRRLLAGVAVVLAASLHADEAADARFATGGGWAAQPVVLRGDRDAAALLDAARSAAEAGRLEEAAAALSRLQRDFGGAVVGGPYRVTGVEWAAERLAAKLGLRMPSESVGAGGREAVATSLRDPRDANAQAAALATAVAWLDAGNRDAAADAAAALLQTAATGSPDAQRAVAILAVAVSTTPEAAAVRELPLPESWPGPFDLAALREAVGAPYFEPHSPAAVGGNEYAVRFADRVAVFGEDGRQRWAADLGGGESLESAARRVLTESAFGPPTFVAGRLWLVDESEGGGLALLAFDVASGRRVAECCPGAVGTPVVAGDVLLVPVVRGDVLGVATLSPAGDERGVLPIAETPPGGADRWRTRQRCAATRDARFAYFAFNEGLLAAVDVWSGSLGWAAAVPVATTEPATDLTGGPAAAVPRETFCPPTVFVTQEAVVAAAPDWLGPVRADRASGEVSDALGKAETTAPIAWLTVDESGVVAIDVTGTRTTVAGPLKNYAFAGEDKEWRVAGGLMIRDGLVAARPLEPPFGSLPLPEVSGEPLPGAFEWPTLQDATKVDQPGFIPSEAYETVPVLDVTTGRPSAVVGVEVESQRRRSVLIRVAGRSLPVLSLPPFATTERRPEELDQAWSSGRSLLLRLGLQLFRVALKDTADGPVAEVVGDPVELSEPITALRRRSVMTVTQTPFGPLATSPGGRAFGDVAVAGGRVLFRTDGTGSWATPPLARAGVFGEGQATVSVVGGRRTLTVTADGRPEFGGDRESLFRRPVGRVLASFEDHVVTFDDRERAVLQFDVRTGATAELARVAKPGHVAAAGGRVYVWDAADGSVRCVASPDGQTGQFPVDQRPGDIRRLLALPRPDGVVLGLSGDVSDPALLDSPQRGGAAAKPLFEGLMLKVAGGEVVWTAELPAMAVAPQQPSDVPALFFEWFTKPLRADGSTSPVPHTNVLLLDDRDGRVLLEASAGRPRRSRLRVDLPRRRLTVDLDDQRFAVPFGAGQDGVLPR